MKKSKIEKTGYPARHYLINSTTAEIFITFDVNGADIEAYA